MNVAIVFLVILHVVICLFLIGVILLQQGKSADLAGAFGGQGSQTAFGPRSAANLLTRLTTTAAVLFVLTSIALTVLFTRTENGHSVTSGIKTSAPASNNK
jgi:preprotein translocase subunit SecG